MTIWNKLEKFPPVLIRLLARKGGEAMTDREIVAASNGNLDLADVRRLSYLVSWEDVGLAQLRVFCLACNADLDDRITFRRLNRYMKDPKFEHLRRSKQWPTFREMLEIYAKTLQ